MVVRGIICEYCYNGDRCVLPKGHRGFCHGPWRKRDDLLVRSKWEIGILSEFGDRPVVINPYESSRRIGNNH
jgi:hypothetical protein